MRDHTDDQERVAAMYRRATSRQLTKSQAEMAMSTLRDLQRRYQRDPEAAAQLLQVGQMSAESSLPTSTLAAFTVLASAFLDLDATIYVD